MELHKVILMFIHSPTPEDIYSMNMTLAMHVHMLYVDRVVLSVFIFIDVIVLRLFFYLLFFPTGCYI